MSPVVGRPMTGFVRLPGFDLEPAQVMAEALASEKAVAA